jgi:hypothetical protein
MAASAGIEIKPRTQSIGHRLNLDELRRAIIVEESEFSAG